MTERKQLITLTDSQMETILWTLRIGATCRSPIQSALELNARSAELIKDLKKQIRARSKTEKYP